MTSCPMTRNERRRSGTVPRRTAAGAGSRPCPRRSDGIAAVEQIEAGAAIAPDADDTQNLILRG